MGVTKRRQTTSDWEKDNRSSLVFRFRRAGPKTPLNPPPFTVMPEELKDSKFSLGKLLRGFFNTLLLLILVLALVALIAAFAYQLIHNPEALGQASYDLVSSTVRFFLSLAPAQ